MPISDFFKKDPNSINSLRPEGIKVLTDAAKAKHAKQEAELAKVQKASDIDGKRVGLKPTGKLIRMRNDDPFAGITCAAAGRGFLSGGKCGRSAAGYFVTATMEVDRDQIPGGGLSIEEQLQRLEGNMASGAPDMIPHDAIKYYRASDGQDYLLKGWVGPSGAVEAGQLMPQPTKLAVCLFHFGAGAEGVSLLHPDDRPKGWEPPVVPVVEAPKAFTLDDLDMTRGITITDLDPTFVSLTDGKVSLLVTVQAAVEKFGLEWWKRILPK